MHSTETRKKISVALRGKPSGTGMLGKRHSEETRRKISEALKGKKMPWAAKNVCNWVKKYGPWNKGRVGIYSKEYRKKLSKAHKGQKLSEEIKRKISLALKGEKNVFWKGENVGYRNLHHWVERNLGRPTQCKICGRDNLSGKKIHWANKSRKYHRTLDDWLRLCAVCHRQYDQGLVVVK
jgi:hypothetical protein